MDNSRKRINPLVIFGFEICAVWFFCGCTKITASHPAVMAIVVPGNSDLVDKVRVELSSTTLAHRRMYSLVRGLLVLLSEPRSPSC